MSTYNLEYNQGNAWLKFQSLYKNNRVLNARLVLSQQADTFVARLYDTNIFRVNLDNSIVLNSGGYKTKTTKARINDLLPSCWSLYQEDFQWIIVYWTDNKDAQSAHAFKDYMRLNADGTVTYN